MVAQTYESLYRAFKACVQAGGGEACQEQADELLAYAKEEQRWEVYATHFISRGVYIRKKALKAVEQELILEVEQLAEDSIRILVQAIAYEQLLLLAYQRQKFKLAVQFGLNALEVLEQAPPSPSHYQRQEQISHNLSNIYLWSLGQNNKALDYAKQSLDYAELAYGREHERTVHATGNLAVVYNVMGARRDALDYYKRSIAIAEKLEETPNLIIAKSRLYQNVATLEEQNLLTYLEEALELLKKIEAWGEVANILGRIGTHSIAIGDFDAAKAYFEESLELIKQHSDQGIILNTKSQIYQGYAAIALAQKQLDLAKSYYNKALAIYQEAYPDGRIHFIASIYNSMGDSWKAVDLSESIRYYQQAIVANTPSLSLEALEKSPENCLQQSIFNYGSMITALNGYAATLYARFQEHGNLQDLETALTAINTLVEIGYQNMERLTTPQDQLSLLESLYENFALGISIAHELYQKTNNASYMETAFKFCESNKSYILQQSLNHGQALKNSQVPEEMIQREYQIKVKLSQLEQERLYSTKDSLSMEMLTEEIFKQKEALKDLYRQLKQDYSRYYQLAYQNERPRISEITQYLDPQEALLEYFMTQEALFLFYIPQEGQAAFFRIELDNDFDQQIRRFHLSLSDFDFLKREESELLKDYSQQAYKLYKRLIPSAIDLSKHPQLRIVADAQLNYIPFGALIRQEAGAKTENFAELDYLSRHHAISYVYSSSLLQELSENKTGELKQHILGIAAAYNQEQVASDAKQASRLRRLRKYLQELPAAREEVAFLQASFNGDYYFDQAANEALFKDKAASYAIIHLAMHGILNEANPSNSALVFSEDGTAAEDDFLHVYELMQMDLQADLVVLSACETGFGKFEQGEGVMSLARAFMYTGSKSLLMSLWQVNDQATAALMQSFYQNLAKGQNKAVALQRARIDYLQQAQGLSAHPAFWSAFIQLGDTAPIQIQKQSMGFYHYIFLSAMILILLIPILLLVRKKFF